MSSKSSTPKRHFATRPHGLLLIGAVIFAIAWFSWNVLYTSAATP